MTRRGTPFDALLLLMLMTACNQHQSYQVRRPENQLSPAVKAAILAALGPNVSDNDLTEFIRAAKLASRTNHDAEVVATLDEAVALLRVAVEDEYRAQTYRKEEKKLRFAANWNHEINTEGNSEKVCAETTDPWMQSECKEGHRLVNSQRAEAQRNADVAESWEAESTKNKPQAEALIKKLQAELNQIPPKS